MATENRRLSISHAVCANNNHFPEYSGKWDVGYIKRHCLPTYRGYDTFLGYYTACTSDYWYHGAPGGNLTFSKCGGVDFHDSNGTNIQGAAMNGPKSLNNTYDQQVFTSRAVEIIEKHPRDGTPLFIYLAYHNVHDTCQGGGEKRLGLNAPMDTVRRYARTELDIWKVQGAMTTELDYGLGNLSAALEREGMWNNSVSEHLNHMCACLLVHLSIKYCLLSPLINRRTELPLQVLVFVSDNGGPLGHSNNYPLRGGKGSLWEGGVRVEAWVRSPLIPAHRRGAVWPGLAHSSDWYVTLVEGVAGAAKGTSEHATGPRAPDGKNLWPALIGSNLTSPRVEVVHRVMNRYFNNSLGDRSGMAARFGNMKIIAGVSCQDKQVWQRWPAPAPSPVPFGLSGGVLEPGTDHARVAALSNTPQPGAPLGADPQCETGLPVDYHGHGVVTCCPKECGVCGAANECQLPVKDGQPCPCASRPGGASACCVGSIEKSGRMCATHNPPCIVSSHKKQQACLFNLTADPEERHDLAGRPEFAQLVRELLDRLLRIGATGPPLRDAFPSDIGMKNATASAQSCARTERTGFLGPLD